MAPLHCNRDDENTPYLNRDQIMDLSLLGIHDHACHIYDDHDDLFAVIARYLEIGLQQGEKCVFVSDIRDGISLDTFIRGLECHGIDVNDALSSGAFVICRDNISSFRQGVFEREELVHFLANLVQSAMEEGYKGLRYAIEMSWFLSGCPESGRLMEYEAVLGDFFRKHDALGMCFYSRKSICPEIIKEVVHAHPHIIISDTVCKKWKFVPPEEYSPGGKTAGDTDSLLRSINRTIEVEEKLRESEQRFTEFVEGSPDAIIIHNGETIEYVNRAGLALFGADSPLQMAGMLLVDFLRPDCRPTISGHIMVVRENGTPAPPVKQKLRRLNGSVFYAEVTAGSFIYNGKRALFSVIRDVDRQERAEEELHKSEIRYRELVESANSIILRFDASFYITFMNSFARYFFGCANRNVIGRKLMDVMAPSADTSGRYVKSIIEDIFRNPQKYGTHENEVSRGDGSRAWIAWTNKLVFDESGRFKEILSIGNDITERKRAEDALIASREQLKQVGAELSMAEERERQRIANEFHDVIGQNLAVAKIKLDTLLMAESSSELTPCIREIRELVNATLKELRSQLFQISPPVLHMVGFEAAVEALCEKYQEDCAINVTFVDDGKAKPIGKDMRGTLYAMVRELLLNVAKHARAANILVSLEKMEDTLEIRVEDDGCGFDPANICLPGDKRSCLGLFSIRQRIEYLGGSLSIDSAPGRGSRITVVAPLTHSRRESRSGEPPDPHSPAKPHVSGKR